MINIIKPNARFGVHSTIGLKALLFYYQENAFDITYYNGT